MVFEFDSDNDIQAHETGVNSLFIANGQLARGQDQYRCYRHSLPMGQYKKNTRMIRAWLPITFICMHVGISDN